MTSYFFIYLRMLNLTINKHILKLHVSLLDLYQNMSLHLKFCNKQIAGFYKLAIDYLKQIVNGVNRYLIIPKN